MIQQIAMQRAVAQLTRTRDPSTSIKRTMSMLTRDPSVKLSTGLQRLTRDPSIKLSKQLDRFANPRQRAAK
jgi:hypothetical protein